MNKKIWIILIVGSVFFLGLGTGLGMLIINNRTEIRVETLVLETKPLTDQKYNPINSGQPNQLKSEYEEYEKKWAEKEAANQPGKVE